MLNHYYVRLIHDNIEKRYKQCRAMHIMVCFFLFFLIVQTAFSQSGLDTTFFMLVIPTLMIAFVALFNSKNLRHSYNNSIFRIIEIGLLLSGAEFFKTQHNWIIAFLFLLIALFVGIIGWMEFRIFNKQFIDFFDKQIIIPQALFNDKKNWADIHHVIIINNYITIEYKNNTFFQHQVYDSFTDIERINFYNFCEQCIQRNS